MTEKLVEIFVCNKIYILNIGNHCCYFNAGNKININFGKNHLVILASFFFFDITKESALLLLNSVNSSLNLLPLIILAWFSRHYQAAL